MEVFVLSYQADGQVGKIFKVVGAFASLEAASKAGEKVRQELCFKKISPAFEQQQSGAWIMLCYRKTMQSDKELYMRIEKFEVDQPD